MCCCLCLNFTISKTTPGKSWWDKEYKEKERGTKKTANNAQGNFFSFFCDVEDMRWDGMGLLSCAVGVFFLSLMCFLLLPLCLLREDSNKAAKRNSTDNKRRQQKVGRRKGRVRIHAKHFIRVRKKGTPIALCHLSVTV